MAFKKTNTKATEVKFEVIEDYGVVGMRGDYELKLQYISWNDGDPKYDLRPWKDGKCQKGITLSGDELEGLYNILQKIAEDTDGDDVTDFNPDDIEM